jgi:uncharacterized protein (DUF1330 family)
MSSFYLLQITVKDPVKLKNYTDVAPQTILPFGGELVFRSKVSEILCGDPDFSCAVAIKFPYARSAKGWYESEEYQSLIENRDAAAKVVVTQYDESAFF